MSDNRHWLIAADAGSNDVTVFSTRDGKVTVIDRQASGGVMPISIALDGDLVIILNAGAPANITGFQLTPRGALIPVPGSTRVLPGAAPAQVSFANHGLDARGCALLDAVDSAGYYDQAHLTRSFRRLVGQTPAKVIQGETRLSFLYKTQLPR